MDRELVAPGEAHLRCQRNWHPHQETLLQQEGQRRQWMHWSLSWSCHHHLHLLHHQQRPQEHTLPQAEHQQRVVQSDVQLKPPIQRERESPPHWVWDQDDDGSVEEGTKQAEPRECHPRERRQDPNHCDWMEL